MIEVKPDYLKIDNELLVETKSKFPFAIEGLVEIDILEFLDKYNHHDLISVYHTDYMKFEGIFSDICLHFLHYTGDYVNGRTGEVAHLIRRIKFHYYEDGRLSSITILTEDVFKNIIQETK